MGRSLRMIGLFLLGVLIVFVFTIAFAIGPFLTSDDPNPLTVASLQQYASSYTGGSNIDGYIEDGMVYVHYTDYDAANYLDLLRATIVATGANVPMKIRLRRINNINHWSIFLEANDQSILRFENALN
jgi:hypothetical protein